MFRNDPITSPVFRLGIASLLLGCAALAIAYAWIEYDRTIRSAQPETPPAQSAASGSVQVDSDRSLVK